MRRQLGLASQPLRGNLANRRVQERRPEATRSLSRVRQPRPQWQQYLARPFPHSPGSCRGRHRIICGPQPAWSQGCGISPSAGAAISARDQANARLRLLTSGLVRLPSLEPPAGPASPSIQQARIGCRDADLSIERPCRIAEPLADAGGISTEARELAVRRGSHKEQGYGDGQDANRVEDGHLPDGIRDSKNICYEGECNGQCEEKHDGSTEPG